MSPLFSTSDASSRGAGTRPSGTDPLLRESLRWRIPVSFGALILVVLTSFLWATRKEVARTLVGAGADRAEAAASEFALRLSSSVREAISSGDRLVEDPAVRAYLADPGAGTRAAAREVLESTLTPGARRAELWDTAGVLLMEIARSPADSVPGIRVYPPGSRPDYVGPGPIRASGEFHYFDMVAEIRADSSAGAPLLGYLRRFGQFTTSASRPVRRLLGEQAVLKVGTAGAVWTDFGTVVEAPPRATPGAAAGEYLAGNGEWWVGGGARIEGTPWDVWVGYPRALILAPTQAFIRRLLIITLLLIFGSITAAAILGSRLTRPLRALAKATEEIASGDYSRRVRAHRRDEIGRLSGAFNRMSDRVQEAHNALRESHERTHFALAAAGIGVWELSLDDDAIRCSDSMRLVHGWALAEQPRTGAQFLATVHPEDRDALEESLRSQHEDPFDLSYRVQWPDGTLHAVQGKARVTSDEAGRPVMVLGVSINMTEQQKLESQLRRAQKMEAIGHLAGGVAHDFNNLLTAIVGHGNLILGELPEAHPVRENVAEMLRAADSASGLTRQLLAFGRRQVIQPRVVDVNEVVIRTTQLLGRVIGENIEVVRELSSGLDAVKVDPGQLEQVIMNLAVNARDAMPHGGRLEIRTESTGSGAGGSDDSGSPEGYVVLSVTDTGVGMDAETRNRLFEPFFTTKPVGQGSGLGLATVFGIVKQAGGHIDVSSEAGRGASFHIHLPATTEKPVPEQPVVADVPVGGTERILLVEDYAPVRAIARKVLKRIGYDVVAVASGEEALATLAADGGPPDLILSDVVMPGMTGPELCRRIEDRYPDVRVLFTSGYSGDALNRHGVRESTVLFLEKPYTPAALASKVREALGREVTPAG